MPLPDKPSIAVLAFTNMSGDVEQEYFSDGIAEDIIIELSRDRTLFVIARNSSFTYKARSVDVRQVARELGVRYVVEGSVRREAGRVRVNAQLIDATTGDHVWAERYDRALEQMCSQCRTKLPTRWLPRSVQRWATPNSGVLYANRRITSVRGKLINAALAPVEEHAD